MCDEICNDAVRFDKLRSNQGHVIENGPVSWKRCTLVPSLVQETYRKSYPGNLMVLSDLTYGDLERSNQGHVIQNGSVSWKKCTLVHQ